MTPMPPACAMAMAMRGFGDRVHGGGDDRQVEGDRAGQPGADVDFAGQHLRLAGPEQNVVEGQRLARMIVVMVGHANSVSPQKEVQGRGPEG